MPGKRKKLKRPTSGPPKSPFVSGASDFCDFGSLGTQESRGSTSENESLDSDVEDAIYARMYFDESNAVRPQLLEDVIEECKLPPSPTTTDEEARSDKVFSVSLDVSLARKDESTKGADEAVVADSSLGVKRKRKSRHKATSAKKSKLSGPVSEPTDTTADTADVIVIDSDSDTSVIVLDSYSAPISPRAKGTPKVKNSGSKSDNASPETAISLLFQERAMSSGSGDTRSSVESGELVSRGASASSDMDLCSEGAEAIENLWAVNEKDKLGRDAYDRLHKDGDSAGRYYEGKRTAKCSNCKQKGHAGKSCPWPKRHNVCYLCAEIGHMSGSCPKNLCTYCFQKKHRGSSCRTPWAGLRTQCSRCYMRGHHASVCPELWRQYHHTTYESRSMGMIAGHLQRRTDKVYCSNCAAEGHFGFECTRTVPRGNPSYHLPLIACYDQNHWPPMDHHSQRLIRRALSSPRKRPDLSKVSQQPWVFMEAPGKVLKAPGVESERSSADFSSPQPSRDSEVLEVPDEGSSSSRKRKASPSSEETTGSRKKKKKKGRKLEERQATPTPPESTKHKRKRKNKNRHYSEPNLDYSEPNLDEPQPSLTVTVVGGSPMSSRRGVGYDHLGPPQQQSRSSIITFNTPSNPPPRPTSLHETPRPTSLLKTPLTTPNHMHPGGHKRPLLAALPSDDFPREPLHPAPHSSPPYDHQHRPHYEGMSSPETWGRWNGPPNYPPSSDRREEHPPYNRDTPSFQDHHRRHSGAERFSDSFDHTPSPGGYMDPRERYSRSTSFDEGPHHHHTPLNQQRRFSEHLEHNKPQHHHHRPGRHSQGATPSHHTGHTRGEVLSSSRGFQMSEHRARQTGHYQSPRDYNRRTYNQRY